MPFCHKNPEYWHIIEKETKRIADMINSKKLFDDPERVHPITEDDVLWDTVKYIHHINKRLEECRHTRLDIDQHIRNAVEEWKNRKENYYERQSKRCL